MSRHALLLAAAGLVALAALSGCGEEPGYRAGPLETFLESNQADAFGSSADVRQATCPDDATLREGMRLTCKLDVSGTAVPYRVTLTNLHGEKVEIHAAVEGVVIATSAIRGYVRSALPKASAQADVECGTARFVVADVGQRLDCTMTLGPQRKTLKLTVKDDRGTVAIG